MAGPRDTMAHIDAALGRVPADASGTEVRLSWPHYVDLLSIKGLNTDRRQVDRWGSNYIGRPLQQYRGHPHFYIQYASQVSATRPDGSIICIPIKYRPFDGED